MLPLRAVVVPSPYRVAILGCPARPEVAWSRENLSNLRTLGFNVLQLNIAWGSRPADEPLNLEDLLELSAEESVRYPQPVPLRCDPSPARRAARRATLQQRIPLARAAGFRTLFHFGAPFNAHLTYGDNPPNCISDPGVTRRYQILLERFAADFPGVDDLLLYTYDQDAWLCSEFGDCPRCSGVALHQRLVPFVESLAATWQSLNPGGRLWWEPWELSAGQALQCLSQINPKGFGVMLHSNVAEVMVAHPADRFVLNASALASARDIPVVLEGFFGAATEEVEPFTHLQTPLATWRHIQRLGSTPGIVGLKEYYGLLPDCEDPNLRATALYFQQPALSESAALEKLAEPYAPEGEFVIAYWRLASSALELYPWDASWWSRNLGTSDPQHALTAAFIRGQQAHTPSWESTRRAVFMKADDAEADPWLMEDILLRLDLTAARLSEALDLGAPLVLRLPEAVREAFALSLVELQELRRRVVAYVCHIRETLLAGHLRHALQHGFPDAEPLRRQLLAVLESDRLNMGTDEPLAPVIHLLRTDLPAFLATYFLPDPEISHSRGDFSVTSR